MGDLQEAIRQHNESLTLQDLFDGNNELAFQCLRCGDIRHLDLIEEIRKNGGQTRVSFVKRATKCVYCG